MPSKAYPPAEADAIGMADALDYDEEFLDDGNRGGGTKIREQVTLKKSPPPNTSFEPDFGAPKAVKIKGAPKHQCSRNPPPSYAPGLPTDPRQVQEQRSKLADIGVEYEPNKEAPTHPEVRKVTVESAAPSMGSMVTNIPSFAQTAYRDDAPNKETYSDPLAKYGKDAGKSTKIDAPPPPINQSQPTASAPVAPAPAPEPVAPEPSPAPPVESPAPVPTETTTTKTTTAPAAPSTEHPDIPKNAKKIVTTTTTTTRIVDGKEVVETHVHHDVILKKKGFTLPKLFGKKKKTITTTTSKLEECE